MSVAARRPRFRYLPPRDDAPDPRRDPAVPQCSATIALPDCVMLFLFALSLRLLTFGRTHWISPDEFFYTLLARDFSEVWGDPSTYARIVRLETLHASGFAWLLSLVFLLTGEATIEVGRWLGLALNAATIPATYALALAAGYSRRHGFLAGLVLAVIPSFWKEADRVWLDHQATLLITLFWAAALIGWRKRSATWWTLACALLVSVVLTKEYLLFFIALALPFGMLELRQRAGRFAAGASTAMLILAVFGYWLVAYSGWLPHAKYARPWDRDPQVRRHAMTIPNPKKLYTGNAEESELPSLVWMLGLAGTVVAALGTRRNREQAASLLMLSLFGGALAVFISMMQQEFGARLLFPAFPVLALFVAIALLEATVPVVPLLLPLFACGLWMRSTRSYLEQLHGATFYWQVIGFVATAFLFAYLAVRFTRDPRNHVATHALAAGSAVVLMTVMSLTSITSAIRHQSGLVAEIGAQAGLPRLAPRLTRLIGRDAITLSQNPRELAYYLDMSFARLAAQAWLHGTLDDARRHTTVAELAQRKITWVVLVRSPEFEEPAWTQVRDALRRLPQLAPKLEFAGGRETSVAVFKVRSSNP